MYSEHFGLTELPFSLTPDTQYLFSHQEHQAALNTVLVALRSGEGFVKVTGEVGTGKTLLCRRLLQALEGQSTTAYLPNPTLDPRTLYLAFAEELRLAIDPGIDPYHLLKALNTSLLAIAQTGRAVVLLIDEAQAIPLETLEALRLLSNLETEKRKLMQVVLLGQPELDQRLADPSVRQLLQRISFHYRLTGLRRGELALYLAHRLRVAGYRGDELFSKGAVAALFHGSRGTPRLVNILAHKSLLASFGEGRQRVDRHHVCAAASDTQGARRVRWWQR